MKTCNECQHVSRQNSQNPNAWLCDVFPVDKIDPRAGGQEAPYRRVNEVLRISMPNDSTPCVLFEALPEVGEAVVKEARGGKSVTFKDKETDE